METNYYVYKHTNKTNNKVYIGITSQDPNKRWANGKGYSGQRFGFAILKYGWDGFKHEVLYSGLSEAKAKVLEVSLIYYYKSTNPKYGYNVSFGGDIVHHSKETRKKISEAQKGANHHMYGKHLSEETKAKLSEAHKGKVLSDEHKAKLSEAFKGKRTGANHPMYGKRGAENPNYGKTRTEEAKAKMSEIKKGAKNPMYGKHHTEETKAKLSEAHKGKVFSEEHKTKLSEAQKKGFKNPTSKSVICLTTMHSFGSTGEAARFYNIDRRLISKCCNGKRKSAGKFNGKKLQWKFIEDLPKPPMTEEDKKHLRELRSKFYKIKKGA